MPTRRAALIAASVLAAPASAQQTSPDGRAGRLTLAVTGANAPGQVERDYGAFRAAFGRLAGRDLRLSPVGDRLAALAELDAGRVDLVLTGPAEYVVFRARSQVVPVVGITRVDYFAGIAVLARGPVQVPDDLVGQRVGFGDVGSTSRHLGPMQVLADLGLHPRRDIQVLHVPENASADALRGGEVAALAVNHTDVQRLRAALPDTPLRVVARGRDLPDDVILARQHLAAETVETVRRAFVEHGPELLGAATAENRNRKYLGSAFLPSVRDADYNYVRAMYRTAGQPRYSEFIGD